MQWDYEQIYTKTIRLLALVDYLFVENSGS